MPSEKQVIVDATSYTRAEGGAIEDPRAIIAREPMRRAQLVAVAMCIALTALDGFDVLSISFASPGIAAEWGIDRAMLGIVLSMELIGMSAGSIFVGSLADRVGRRPVALGCLVVMAIGMGLATTARDVTHAVGVPPVHRRSASAACSPRATRWRPSSRTRGGGTSPSRSWRPAIRSAPSSGGSIASRLLAGGSWRSVFAFGALVSAAFIPLVWFLMPETVAYLAHRRPANVLERVNAVLRRLGHATVTALPAPSADAPRARLAQLFTPGLARTTVLLTLAYFAHIMTFYFILKWIPKIVVDMGFAPSTGGRRAGVGERRRADRRARAGRAHAARRRPPARDRGDAPRRRDGHGVRPGTARSCAAVADRRRGGHVHQRGHRRPVCDGRAVVSRPRCARGAPASSSASGEAAPRWDRSSPASSSRAAPGCRPWPC